jgi:hypothetical protein
VGIPALAYVQTVKEVVRTNKIGAGIGLGLGYYTRYWITEASFFITNYAETLTKDAKKSYQSSGSSIYKYYCVRYGLGYRYGRNKLLLLPKIEMGINVYDNTFGGLSAINPKDVNSLDWGYTSFDSANNNKFKKLVTAIGLSCRIGYLLNNYLVFIEPFYGQDLENIIKPKEPYSMKRSSKGLRLGMMFNFN